MFLEACLMMMFDFYFFRSSFFVRFVLLFCFFSIYFSLFTFSLSRLGFSVYK